MCFGGSRSSTPQVDPQIKEQQDADMQKAEETKTAQKEQQVQSSVAVNQPLVQSTPTPPSTPQVDIPDVMADSGIGDAGVVKAIQDRAKGTVLRRRKRTGRSSLFTSQGGGIGYYSKYRA
jgi:hypothetical protein|tara:strand:+ start:75 stop:434 length:360 start_codon:yes stop_codon:yes gene_type:complete